jgi:hypothetical protein
LDVSAGFAGVQIHVSLLRSRHLLFVESGIALSESV